MTNADLWSRRGVPPTDDAYDARSVSASASEVVSLGVPQSGYYWIRVKHVSGAGRYRLRVVRESLLSNPF